MKIEGILLLILSTFSLQSCSAFSPQLTIRTVGTSSAMELRGSDRDDAEEVDSLSLKRRDILSSAAAFVVTGGGQLVWLTSSPQEANAADGDVAATDDSETFASISARASKISKEMDRAAVNPFETSTSRRVTDKTAYDFSLPVDGEQVRFADLIRQEYDDGFVKVKAIIVVNIKQDDPIARKTIPELISLATRYGRNANGALAVVCCPTDQGYYEPDTSQLVRLKLSSEYGYGINPATVSTDKVNLLGSGAHPFWRFLQSTCRTPAGLGRIEGNFEKFLVDGRTGLPVRRYPRRYGPLNMSDDIEAVIAGKPLPPAKANWLEEWRSAAVEAERDTYRFEKGLNYFDQ